LLLKEAFPTASGKQLALALYNSARDLGTSGEDNEYGRGLIDVGAAYNWMIAQGFQATPPIRASNDVIHVQSKPRIFSCARKAYLEVSFENSGADTLRSLEVAIRREGQSATLALANWTGKLAPGKIATYFVPPFDAPVGRYVVEIDLRNPNGFADARSLNNRMKVFLNVSSQAQLPDATAAVSSVCVGSKALVSSTYQGEGTVRWFNRNTEGTALGTGNSFATGTLTKDTFFFAELTFNRNTGLANQAGAEVVYSDSVGGLVFDVYYPFLLKSVTIYPNRTGLRFITLRRQDGQVRTISYRITRVGEQKVPLNILVTPGENQVLELTRGGDLSILKGNLTYPLIVPDVLAIKYANNTDANEDYPYFFNWEIEHGHPCGRTPVFIDVNPSGNRPQAQFAVPNSPLNTNAALSFQDQSIGATSVQWNFGNGQTSTARNPSTIYTQAGAYLVTLSATNADGCSDVIARSIQIGGATSTQEQDELSYRFSVFPNPVQEQLSVDFDLGQSRQVKLSIINALGQVLQSQTLGKRQAGRETFSLQNLSTGLYWLVFEADGVKVAKPLSKL
jgi:PKD repeat protein